MTALALWAVVTALGTALVGVPVLVARDRGGIR